MRLQAERVIAAEGTSEKLTDALSRVGSGAVEAYAENVPKGHSPERVPG